MDIGACLIDGLYEQLDEFVDLHPVVADVRDFVSIVKENVS